MCNCRHLSGQSNVKEIKLKIKPTIDKVYLFGGISYTQLEQLIFTYVQATMWCNNLPELWTTLLVQNYVNL